MSKLHTTAGFTKKIIHIKLTILVLALLPFIAFTLLTSNTNKIFGIQSFVVLTGSMEPAILQGSLVFTKKQQEYHKGDVIAFKEGNITITHRIVDVMTQNSRSIYHIKGDANNTPDSSLVAAKDVLGKAENTLPHIGTYILFLRTLPGFLTFIVAPVALFILFELWNIKKEIERNVEQKVLKRMQAS